MVKGLYVLRANGAAKAMERIALSHLSIDAIPAIPVMVFAYHCHVQAVPIYYELTDDPKLFTALTGAWSRLTGGGGRRSSGGVAATALPAGGVVGRKLRGAAAVLATAYAECTLLYVSTGIAGYLLYPRDADSNILNNFPPDDGLMQIMRFCVGFAVLLHYPINQHVARSALYDLLCRYTGIQVKDHVPYSHVATLTLFFFVASVTTACLVHDLGVVFQVIGGLAGSMLVFVLPGGLVIAHCRSGGHAAARATPAGDTAVTGTSNGSAMEETALLLLPQANGGSYAAATARAAAERRGGASCSSEVPGLAAADGEPAPGEPLEASPLHSPIDTEVVGWLLVLLGVAVFAVTLYLTALDVMGPGQRSMHAGDAAGDHARRLLMWAP